MKKIRFLLMLLLPLCFDAFGQIYQCTESDGSTTFSQKPCNDGELIEPTASSKKSLSNAYKDMKSFLESFHCDSVSEGLSAIPDNNTMYLLMSDYANNPVSIHSHMVALRNNSPNWDKLKLETYQKGKACSIRMIKSEDWAEVQIALEIYEKEKKTPESGILTSMNALGYTLEKINHPPGAYQAKFNINDASCTAFMHAASYLKSATLRLSCTLSSEALKEK